MPAKRRDCGGLGWHYGGWGLSGGSQNTDKEGVFHGLKSGELTLSRRLLTGVMPAVSTFCWFAALVLFAQISFLIYRHGENKDEAIRAFALMACLHVGALVSIYLCTLAEKDNPEFRRNAKFPFALSLLASLVETLGIAGVLIYLMAKSVIDLHSRLGSEVISGGLEPQPLIHEMLRLIPTLAEERGVFIGITAGLLVCTLIVAHYAFSLMRRRSGLDLDGVSSFSGIETPSAPPQILSDDLKAQINKLNELKARLISQAEAVSVPPGVSIRINEINDRLKSLGKALEAQKAQMGDLPEQEARIKTLSELIDAEKARFEADLAKAPAGSMQRHLKRVASLLIGALGLISQVFALFEDSRADMQAEIDTLETQIDTLEADRARLEAQKDERRAESDKLRLDVDEIAPRVERLSALAAKIDEINKDWHKPRHWRMHLTPDDMVIENPPIEARIYRRNHLMGFRAGIFLLFMLTTLLGVCNDFLIQLHPIRGLDPEVMMSAKLIGLLLLAYLSMKFIYPIGFIGSWQSIASSAQNPREVRASLAKKPSKTAADSQSQPSFAEAVRVIIANLCGLIVFDIIFTTIYYRMSDNPGTLWALIAAKAHDYYLIPFLFCSALFICVIAPLWVYVWERYSRWAVHAPSKLERPLIWCGLVLAFIGTLFAGFMVIGMLGAALQDRIVGPSPVTQPATIAATTAPRPSQLECPFTQVKDAQGLSLTAWSYNQRNRLELDLSQLSAPCALHIANDAETNFVVVLGLASEEGQAAIEHQRVRDRMRSALGLIDWSEMQARKITVYGWMMGRHRKVHGEAAAGTNGELTRAQRPLIIISGFVADPADSEAIKTRVNEALMRNLGFSDASAALERLDYPDAEATPKPTSKPKPAEITAPVATTESTPDVPETHTATTGQ